jgi:rhodanese-related sulfurtransferase
MPTSTQIVTGVAAAEPAVAAAHFRSRLQFETDCDDVALALTEAEPGFVVLDSRSPQAFAAGHVPGAVNLPRPFTAEDVAALHEGMIVVYCWGPGCNGSQKACLELCELARPVKEMLGGFEYWVREGHPVEPNPGAYVDGVDGKGIVKLRGEISCLC